MDQRSITEIIAILLYAVDRAGEPLNPSTWQLSLKSAMVTSKRMRALRDHGSGANWLADSHIN